MRFRKTIKGCMYDIVKEGEHLVIKAIGNKCPKKEILAQEIIDSVKNEKIIIR